MRRFLSRLQKISFLKRLIPSILRRIPFNKSINIKIDNFYINLNLESSIDRYIFLKGFYDRKKIDYIESKINPEEFDYFLDIGSNIYFGILFAFPALFVSMMFTPILSEPLTAFHEGIKLVLELVLEYKFYAVIVAVIAILIYYFS